LGGGVTTNSLRLWAEKRREKAHWRGHLIWTNRHIKGRGGKVPPHKCLSCEGSSNTSFGSERGDVKEHFLEGFGFMGREEIRSVGNVSSIGEVFLREIANQGGG